jgi:hypothetical protein
VQRSTSAGEISTVHDGFAALNPFYIFCAILQLREGKLRFPQFIAAWLALICAVAPAHADKRVALVIGNDRYANLPASEQLQKAVNDAHAVGEALTQIGFEVMTGENVDRLALVDKLDAFARRLSQGDTAFFFFSGHGVAIGGANYVLPADIPNVEADQETRLARVALSEQDIVSDLQARGVRVAVVVLDACRTNPFARPGARGVGGERGLAPPPQVKGVFSLYAASSGQAARDRLTDDDHNPNSVFSRVLVPALTKPGLDLTALAFDVREEVARVAKNAGYVQEPAYYDGTIGGRVYLAGAPPDGGQTAKERSREPPAADAAQAWGIIQNTTSLAVLDDFIRQFGNAPVYGSMARARREELAKGQAKPPAAPQIAAVAPPAEPVAPVTGPLKMSGHWSDLRSPGAKIQVTQVRNEFSFKMSGVLDRGPLAGIHVNSVGNGQITGNDLTMNYTSHFANGSSFTGFCSGVSRKDGIIAWACKDSNSVEFTPTWTKNN